MWFVPVLASIVICGGRETRASIVRANLDSIELAAARSRYVGRQLDILPPSCAAELLAQWPSIKHAAVIEAVGQWFARNHYRPAIPALIRSIDKPFPPAAVGYYPAATSPLADFGADAVPYLIQACRHGSANQIVVCARLLSGFCINKPVDARVIRLLIDLSTSLDPRLRQVAVRGLWRAAVIFHDWGMDDIHYVEMSRPDLLRYIIDVACSSDNETTAVAQGYLFRLVWQDDLRLAPKNRASNDPPPFLKPEQFEQALASKQPEVRAAAVVLQREGDGLSATRLKALSDPDPLVFHAAVASSKVKISIGWLPHLIKLASSDNAQLRRAAALLLVASFDPAAKPTLRKLGSDPDPNVRYAARFSW